MRRRLFIAAIFLLAGAVVNVAVAWGCAVCLDPYDETRRLTKIPLPEDVQGWGVRPWRCSGAERVIWQRLMFANAPGLDLGGPLRTERPAARISPWSRVNLAQQQPDEDVAFIMEDARGWPRLALFSVSAWSFAPFPHARYRDGIGVVLPTVDALSGRSWLERWYFNHRIGPVIPIWPGFVVNTLFYAAALWLLICGPFTLRRFLRVRRGLCPACAYPVGQGPVCTECGRELSRRASA